MAKEITEQYICSFGGMWSLVDKRIVELVISHTSDNNHLLEVGFGSGHFLAILRDNNRVMTGIEIRKDAYTDTQKRLSANYLDIDLIMGDVMELDDRYDLVYSTGLIQCKCESDRRVLLEHISSLSNKVIYTVPRIDKDRNITSSQQIGVSGCAEYVTGNIAYELSELYSYVEEGIWTKDSVGLDDDFLWFYCDGSRSMEGNKL